MLKKNLNASRPSEFVVSHIQRIDCQPEKTITESEGVKG